MIRRCWILFAIALAARVLAAATSSLYVDEAFGYFMSRHDFADIIVGSRADNNPPLWYFIMHPLALATHSGLLLRLPSCLLGALAAPVVYLAGRRFSEEVGLWSGALVALAYTSWLVDAQTRAYGLVALLAALALWMLLSVRSEDRDAPPGGWAALTAVAVALPLFHYVGLLLDVALLASCLVPRMRHRGRTAACLAAGAVAAALWMGYALSNPSGSGLRPRALARSDAEEALALPGFLSGLPLPMHWQYAREWPIPHGTIVVSLMAGALLLIGLWRLWRDDRPAAWTLACFVLVPIAGIVAGALAGLQPYQNRYLVPIAGGFYILTAVGARGIRPALVVMLGINLITLLLFPSDRFLWNQDWRSAADWLQKRDGPSSTVVAYTPYSLVGLDFYYHAPRAWVDFSRPATMEIRFASDYGGMDQVPVVPGMLGPELEKRLAGRRVFLLFNQGDPASLEAIWRWFNERWQLTGQQFETRTLTQWGTIGIYELVPR